MPETTESTTFDLPAEEVFARVADFSRLDEWDDMFDESTRIDDGPLGVGAQFRAKGSTAGRDIDLHLTVVEYDPPRRIVLNGRDEGLETEEIIEVANLGDGCEVTYRSSFETDAPAVADAAMQVPFWFVGKSAIKGMQDWLEGEKD